MKNKYVIDWEKYAKLARRAAAEGAVLLKNDNQALPLTTGRISVFGRIQFDYFKSGTGSGGLVNAKYVVGILDALKEEESLTINEELEQVYRSWIGEHPFDQGTGWAQEPWSQEEMPLEQKIVEGAAAKSDAAVVIIGRTAGEDRDATQEKGSYLLTDLEEEMLAKVCGAFERVIVVLNVGSIIDMKWVKKYNPSAVLYTWQGGQEGGHSVADVLTGRVNPCGKMADTIAYDITDYPSTENFGGENTDIYAEDIYVGYRYFETFAREKVVYPFGFGLSYTTFETVCKSVERQGDKTVVSVNVTNTGTISGREVVQVYVNPAQGKLGKPCRNLAAFGKTTNLTPGESQELVLTIEDYSISSYDDSGLTGCKSCYVLEAGTYEIYAGTDVRSASLAGSFRIEETKVTSRCTEAAGPVREFKRMRAVCGEDGISLIQGWEDTPLRPYKMKEREAGETLPSVTYTGDKGHTLGDVYEGTVSMEEFLAQLSDEDLCCIVRGEGMCSPKVTPGTAAAFGGVTESLQKLGVPCGCCADGPSGIRMDCGTPAFSMPNGTCLACTFDTELSEKLYEMEGAELRKNRIDTLLGPGMNIHRNPLNGRNFEYFSEDPYLTGIMASAQLKGMAAYGVTGTVKHFAANNQEYHRRLLDSVMSERALREIYLKGFEIAVKEGGAYSIMTTYGAINGLWTASNYDLLTTILRDEWKFDGMVMTDWWADLNDEDGPASTDNLAAMVRSQNDVYMVTQDALTNKDNLMESLKNGTLKRSALLRCAKNICAMLMKSPVMERSLGKMSKEEQEAAEAMAGEDKVDFDITYYDIDETLVLDGSDIDTTKGKSIVYGIRLKKFGAYTVRLKVKADAGKVAQIPVSIFANGHLEGTITINGTDGQWLEIEKPVGPLFGPHNYIRLYFAQSGMQIESVSILLKEEMTREF